VAVKRRLGIVLYSLSAGGAERVVSVLLPYLLKRYEITLFLMNDTLYYSLPQGVETVWLEHSAPDEPGWLKLLKLPLLAWRLKRACQKRRIKRVLTLMNRPNYIGVLAKLYGWRGYLIIGERGTPSRQYAGNTPHARINRWLIRTLYPRADKVTANSYGALTDLKERFGVPPQKLAVFYNPFKPPERIQVREAVEKESGTFVFVTVGRLDEGKNHRMLIEAFKRVRQPHMRLWIVGDGPLRSELEAQAKSLDGAVTFWGRQDPFALLHTADVFVFGSKREGLPNVLIEALYCRLPVISTDCMSGPREILADERDYAEPTRGYRVVTYGILVEEENVQSMAGAMKEVYNNKNLREMLAERAAERADFFQAERAVLALQKWLEEQK